jgi:hypothetical protein|tara:strand:- start:8382 stop:8579 length:198 start_codon:yes stop_codon:yes gene_type:complete
MDEIHTAEAVFRIIRDRRQGIVDLMMYGNVKSMEQYRELMGNMESLNHVEQELKHLLDKQERSND